MAGIRHGNLNHVICGLGVGGDSSRWVELRHRFQRIAEKIDQNLLDLDPVGKHQVAGRIELEAQLTPLVRGRR